MHIHHHYHHGPTGFVVSPELIGGLLLYNLVVWLVFSVVYNTIDFPKHFDVPDYYTHTLDNSMYFSWQVQSQMFGTNVIPRTKKGRIIVALHGVFAWTQTIIFLAPWAIFPRRVVKH